MPRNFDFFVFVGSRTHGSKDRNTDQSMMTVLGLEDKVVVIKPGVHWIMTTNVTRQFNKHCAFHSRRN